MEEVIYQGIFINGDEIYKLKELDEICRLLKSIDKPHITFQVKPSDEEKFPEELIGQEVRVIIEGFGCDENNAAFSCRVVPWTTDLKKEIRLSRYYKGPKNMHITMSLSETGRVINSAQLNFRKYPFKTEVRGKFGLFTNNGYRI